MHGAHSLTALSSKSRLPNLNLNGSQHKSSRNATTIDKQLQHTDQAGSHVCLMTQRLQIVTTYPPLKLNALLHQNGCPFCICADLPAHSRFQYAKGAQKQLCKQHYNISTMRRRHLQACTQQHHDMHLVMHPILIE